MEGFYRALWQRLGRQRLATRKSPTEALAADVSLQILGLLAAAQEPLGSQDLLQLLGPTIPDHLPELPDQDPGEVLLRLVIRKERLGRLLIGAERLSLFHDTLRRFILDNTKRAGDDLPHAEATEYHARLAEWCRQRANPGYSERHLTHHLLCSRRYEELVALFADASDSGRFRRVLARNDGGAQLVRELRHATLAARELNRLDELFRLSMLTLAVDGLRQSAVMPGAARLLLELGDHRGVEMMFEACRDPSQGWKIASAAYVDAVSRAGGDAEAAWMEQLRRLVRSLSGLSRIEECAALVAELLGSGVTDVEPVLDKLTGLGAEQRAEVACRRRMIDQARERGMEEVLKLLEGALATYIESVRS